MSVVEELHVTLGRARVEAIPRDPHSAWTYWELTAKAVRSALPETAAIREIPVIELQVRIRPADGEPTVTTSYRVDHWVAGRFVEGLEPGMPFDVVIGAVVDDVFHPIVNSSLKRAPRDKAGRGLPTFVTLARESENGVELEVTDYAIPEEALNSSDEP